MKTTLLTSAALLILMTAPLPAHSQPTTPATPATQTIPLIGTNNTTIGAVDMTEVPEGFEFRVSVQGLPPGWHAFHIHNIGDCSDPVAFQAAGSHLAQKGQTHGILSAHGPEEGDLPNIWVGQDGTGKADFFSAIVTHADVYDADGSAFIVHSREDDMKSQPAGEAGTRVACGVISPNTTKAP